MQLFLALIAYIASLTAYATMADCRPTPGPWRPAVAVRCMVTPDELLLAEQRVESAMEELIGALNSEEIKR